MEVIEAEYQWIVKKSEFSLKHNGEYILSPTFSFKTTREIKWNIEFYPQGNSESSQNYVSIYLYSLNDFDIQVHFTISISNCKTNKILRTLNNESTFQGNQGNGYGYDNMVNYDLIANDDIKIICKICKINAQVDQPSLKAINDKMKLELLDSQNHFDKLGELLSSGAFSDVIIKVNKKEFKAHKNILASHSSVFKAMFSNNVKENLENIIKIVDIDSVVMEEVLYFMYTGKVKQMSNLTMKIFVAADKYMIDGLKTICVRQMLENITVKNVIELLNFACSYDYDGLYNDCIKFIAEHSFDLLKY